MIHSDYAEHLRTLGEVLGYLKNWFAVGVYPGTYTVSGQSLLPAPAGLQEGQYYLISGSIFNDGVHRYGVDDDTLEDEAFIGDISPMAIPRDLLALVDEIAEWCRDPDNQPSAYTSESFDGYSYTRQAGTDGRAFTWVDAFAPRLRRWRRV